MIELRRLFRLLKKIYQGRQYFCPACNKRLWRFTPFPTWYFRKFDEHGYIHSIFALETLNLFESSCPSCGSSDTYRLYALYIRQKFATLDTSRMYTFIDFAPVPYFTKFLKRYPFLKYRSADLLAGNVDDKADIMDMQIYKDNSVDMLLCSHVLEHVEDDRKAMRELYRILMPGGWGIVMSPIQLTLSEVSEDASITSEADRWKHFGQGDHLRLYSKQGFVSRLEEVGFRVNQLGIDHFGTDTFEKHGILSRSVLYVVEKAL